MSGASTHFKLGIFTILALVAMLVVVFGLGLRGFGIQSDSVQYHSYFDESVQGLEVGSPVKYRGVAIGHVADVQIAPDRKHVDTTLTIDMRHARELGLADMAPGLRAQLATQGITGVKFVDIDFFDPKTNPPPALPFAPAANHIPATPSLFKGLEDNLDVTSRRLPELIDVMIATLGRIERMLDAFQGEELPARLGKAIDDVDGAAKELHLLLAHVDRADLPGKTATSLDALNGSLARVNVVLDRLGGDGGLVASTQRATDGIGDLGRTTKESARDLDRTLRDLDEAAQAIRDLAQAIEREPDMLVKGRAEERGR